MSEGPSQEAAGDSESKPGKIRTWWHPLLVRVLRWQLGKAYEVLEELPLGKKPLQLDVVMVRAAGGLLGESVRQMLAGLVDHLNEHTLVEFKGPTDSLRVGDFHTFLAYAHHYCAQTDPYLSPDSVNLVLLAPRLTESFRAEVDACEGELKEESPGVWCLKIASLFPFWILESERLGDVQHPLIAVLSPVILNDSHRLFRELKAIGLEELMAYMAQQIQQFHLQGEDFSMQHLGTEEMARIRRDLLREVAEESSPEELREIFPPEKVCQAFTPEERLQGLSPTERLQGLTPEERQQLRDYFHQTDKDNP